MADRKAVRLIKRIAFREISLVDEGDNPHADAVIVKARGGAGRGAAILDGIRDDVANGGIDMVDVAEIEKRLIELEGEMTTLEKRATNAENLVKIEKDRADKAEAAVAELEKGKPVEQTADEDIFKGLSPALRERFEMLEKRAVVAEGASAKLAEERETEAMIAKAKTLGVAEADKVGGLLYRIAKGKTTAEDATAFEDVLTKAANIAKNATLFKTAGATNAVEGDEESVLKQKAIDIQKAKPTLTYEQAYGEALNANPDLYNAIVAKRRGTAAA